MKEKITEILAGICIVFLVVLLFWMIFSNIKDCIDNPNLDKCKVEEQEQTSNDDGGIKCGWVFGSGFRCGVGF